MPTHTLTVAHAHFLSGEAEAQLEKEPSLLGSGLLGPEVDGQVSSPSLPAHGHLRNHWALSLSLVQGVKS